MRRQRYRHRPDGFHNGFDPDEQVVSVVSLNPVSTRVAEIAVREGFHVRLIDADEVAHHDLYGCSLFSEKDIGSYKAAAAKRSLKKIASSSVVKGFDTGLSEDSDYLLQGDLLLSFADDASVNSVVADRGFELGVGAAAVVVSDGELHVCRPDRGVPSGRDTVAVDPATASVGAGLVVQRLGRWFANGVDEESVGIR
jgi:molybdopterin/thiamine biosynthesis adenylyltransferase